MANNTTTTLASVGPLHDKEVLVFPAPGVREAGALEIYEGSVGIAPGGGKCIYQRAKTAGGLYDVKIRHQAGAALTFDWVVYKVFPL